jgi:TIR domain
MYELDISTRVLHGYDAFISYNSRDREEVENIARELEDAGLSVWKDDWELVGGDNWMDALPDAIARSRALVAFIGPNGFGPWHKTEIDIGLKRAIETKAVRVIPVAIKGCPAHVQLPDYLQMRQLVDLRNQSPWQYHQLRCAIVGARPGRRDEFESAPVSEDGHNRLQVLSCKISNTFSTYMVVFRVANPGRFGSLVVDGTMVRVHEVAPHPIKDELPVYLAPISRTRVAKRIQVTFKQGPVYANLQQDRYLIPGEVEDVEVHIEVAAGLRALLSTGVLWSVPGEPLTRLTEVGYFTVGHRGIYSDSDFAYAPTAGDSYSPGQHNLDPLIYQRRPEWPPGWPATVSRENWAHYMAGESGPDENSP